MPYYEKDTEHDEELYKVGKEVNLTKANLDFFHLVTVYTRCLKAPKRLKGRLPTINNRYIDRLMKDPGCSLELAGVGCSKDYIPVVEVRKVGSARTERFPRSMTNPDSVNLDLSPVAGVACIKFNSNTGYTDVRIWAGVYLPFQKNSRNNGRSLRWLSRRLILPPSSLGHAGYLAE